MLRPEGIYVAMMTPFDSKGQVNEKELRRIVDFHVDSGLRGLFPVSSVGEFLHLSREEKLQVMEIVADQNRGRLPLIPGIGGSHPRECVFLASRAEELGCDGVVLPPPYFYPLPAHELRVFLETVIQGSPLPVIVYNVPLFAQPLPYGVVEGLFRLDGVVGMKDSSGSMVDFMNFLDIARDCGRDIGILIGREETLFAALAAGGKGCMTATAGILPEIMNGIYKAYVEKDYQRARELQDSIIPLLRAIYEVPFPLGFKLALEARGFELGPPRHLLKAGETGEYIAAKARIMKLVKELVERIRQER